MRRLYWQSNFHVIMATAVSFKEIWHITSQQTSQAPIPIAVALAVVAEQWMETATQIITLVEHVRTPLMKFTLGGGWTWGKWNLLQKCM